MGDGDGDHPNRTEEDEEEEEREEERKSARALARTLDALVRTASSFRREGPRKREREEMTGSLLVVRQARQGKRQRRGDQSAGPKLKYGIAHQNLGGLQVHGGPDWRRQRVLDCPVPAQCPLARPLPVHSEAPPCPLPAAHHSGAPASGCKARQRPPPSLLPGAAKDAMLRAGSAARNLETWAGASRMGNFPQPAAASACCWLELFSHCPARRPRGEVRVVVSWVGSLFGVCLVFGSLISPRVTASRPATDPSAGDQSQCQAGG